MKFFSLFFVLCSFAACASHPSTQPSSANENSGASQVFVYHLPGPPAAGSKEDQDDYQHLLALQGLRSTAMCTQGQSEVKITLGSFYGPPYGPLTAKEVASLTQLFQIVTKDAWPMIGDAKQNWKRPRPFVAHPDLNPCAKREESFSYPSGHMALARYYMHFLIDLFPERKKVFEERARAIGDDRMVVGVHYPSDVRDGALLGDQIYEHLAQNKKIRDLIALPQLH